MPGHSLLFALAALALSVGLARGAEPIEGRWLVPNGETAEIAPCGGEAYCVTVATGIYKGRRIGRFARSGEGFEGTITDPAKDRTYAGTATIDGGRLKLSGCALKIFCRSQTWTRE